MPPYTRHNRLVCALLLGGSFFPLAAHADAEVPKDVIVVGQKGAPITVVPRGLSVSLGKEQFDAVNALNVEDLMKYTPNFFVRKRFAGDDNAVVAMRGANTVQSARTIVMVDGFLVSNFLGNRYDFPPKWNVVGPAEIRQFDIVYGPYSARYNGNSMGGVISITTDEPKKNGMYATAQTMIMPFKEYGFNQTFKGYSLESGLTWKPKDSPWGLRASYRRFDNVGQSMTYNLLSKASPQPTTTAAQNGYTEVTGTFSDPKLATSVFGAASPVHVLQDQARLRLSYQANNGWKTDGLFVFWKTNQDLTDARTWLKDTSGSTVYQGKVKIGGTYYNASGITYSETDRTEYLTGVRVAGPLGGWNVRANLSRYVIADQDARASNDFLTGINRGAGKQTLSETPGWWAFDASATEAFGAHEITFGLNSNLYETGQTIYSVSNWATAANPTYNSSTAGKTTSTGLFIEDEIDLNDGLSLTLGLRGDSWKAFDGNLGALSGTTKVINRYDERSDSSVDPKVSFQAPINDDLSIQLSLGTATRFPTVGELYQGTFDTVTQTILADSFDPNLKPEKSKDISLILRRKFANASLTNSFFGQDIENAIFSFQGINQYGNTYSNYKNIDRMNQYGVEVIYEAKGLWLSGLDVSASVSWMDAKTLRNASNRAAEGVQFPRIPHWRSNGTLRYAFTPKLKGTLGWRYADRPNSDLFGLTRGRAYSYQSEYTLIDTRFSYDVTPRTQVSIGIDNVANYKAYVSHPLPQRTFLIELKYKQ